MYSNDQTQIRAGLVNYVGAMIASSKFDNIKATKHEVVAILLEEAAKICKDEDGYYDMFITKPILRLTAGISKQRSSTMNSLPSKPQEVKEQIKAYNLIEGEINKILNNIKL